jgi:hypothetical protein
VSPRSTARARNADTGPAEHHDTSPPLSVMTVAGSGPVASLSTPPPERSFDGTSNSDGGGPPSPSGAVGPNHYVEVVNVHFVVFDKSGGVVLPEQPTSVLWSGFGDQCENTNRGDATVLFDSRAQRWVVQKPAFDTDELGNPLAPFFICAAVSTSSDPTGEWNRYSFGFDNFPSDEKVGAWGDGYYVGLTSYTPTLDEYLGPEMCAWDRAAMLTGDSATQQCFQLPATEDPVLPASLDGPTGPPRGTAWFVGLSATQSDALAYWKMHIDWGDPASTFLEGPVQLPVAAFTRGCDACVPQLGTTRRLQGLGDRLLNRLVYRNFGDHESLVASHVVAAGSSTAERWYELRPSSGSLEVFQQGTYAPDPTYRWAGSVAMDGAGGIALGYSASSSSIYPGIRYAGRDASDAAGTLGSEATLIAGGGAQTGSAAWGHFTQMSIDPVDDCSFWYVNEYYSATSADSWRTRIGSFRLAGCQPGLSINDVSVSEGNSETTNATFAVTLSPPSTRTVTVHYATTGGTATDPSDYALTSGDLTFAPGERSKLVNVPVAGDTVVEPDETFSLTLTTPVNAELRRAQGVGTILNDDTTPSGRYTALTPARILDTRSTTPLGPGESRDIQITGAGGVPATGVSAVVMNVTVTGATANGDFLTVFPTGTARPTASNLNFNAGQTVPNLVTVKVGTGGQVTVYNQTGSTHVLFDVGGYYGVVPAGNDGRYQPLTPARILDTRATTPLGPGESRDIQITGAGGVPATGVSAVVMNVTVTGGTANGDFLTVFPAGVTRPGVSNLNFDAGQTIANRVIVKVGTGGKVTVYNQTGSTHVIFDVNGWFTDTTISTGGPGALTALSPVRILDTRSGSPLAGGETRPIQITGQGGVPASGVSAVVMNVTVTQPSANGGFIKLYPSGGTVPVVSDVNFNAGQTVPNLVLVKVGPDGKVNLYNQTGTAHVLFDVVGWYS